MRLLLLELPELGIRLGLGWFAYWDARTRGRGRRIWAGAVFLLPVLGEIIFWLVRVGDAAEGRHGMAGMAGRGLPRLATHVGLAAATIACLFLVSDVSIPHPLVGSATAEYSCGSVIRVIDGGGNFGPYFQARSTSPQALAAEQDACEKRAGRRAAGGTIAMAAGAWLALLAWRRTSLEAEVRPISSVR